MDIIPFALNIKKQEAIVLVINKEEEIVLHIKKAHRVQVEL